MQLTVRQPSAALDAKHYTTERLRSEYVIEKIFVADEAMFTYSHFDRIIAGGVMPVNTAVELKGCKELCSDTIAIGISQPISSRTSAMYFSRISRPFSVM